MSLTQSASQDRHFEDYIPGSVFEYGEVAVSEAEIFDFARRFDPQAMHVDPAAAARGRFGGLIASGWHTAAMTMRLLVDNFLPGRASLASPGIDAGCDRFGPATCCAYGSPSSKQRVRVPSRIEASCAPWSRY